MIDGRADGAGRAVDLFERRRDLCQKEDCAGGGQRWVLLRGLLDFSRNFRDPLHGSSERQLKCADTEALFRLLRAPPVNRLEQAKGDRAELMMRIEDHHKKGGVPQVETARSLGFTAPRFNALLKGRIGLFSLDALVNIATRAGPSVRLHARRAA
jgi:predicted XRE-type DNA-binding protein